MRVLNEVATLGIILTVASATPVLAGGKGGGGGGSHSDIHITKGTDSASPKLAKPLAKGQHIPKTEVHTYRAQ